MTHNDKQLPLIRLIVATDSWQQEYGRKYVEGYEEKQKQKLIIGMLDSSRDD